MERMKGKNQFRIRRSIRSFVRELLALSFWLRALYITKFLPIPFSNSDIPRYLFNASLIIFIINCSLFTDKGWWSVLLDLLFIYFWPFIRFEVGLPPWLRQTVKTQFAVRCKILDRQDHFIAF